MKNFRARTVTKERNEIEREVLRKVTKLPRTNGSVVCDEKIHPMISYQVNYQSSVSGGIGKKTTNI